MGGHGAGHLTKALNKIERDAKLMPVPETPGER